MSKTDVKLASSKDWDAWIDVAQKKADSYDIWDLINRNLETQPATVIRLQEPTLDLPEGASAKDEEAIFKKFKMAEVIHKRQETKWKEQKASFAKIIDLIYDTVTVQNTTYLHKKGSHPWELLRILKQKLAPSDAARLIELRRRYARVRTGPSNRQHIDSWLDEWNQTYTLGREYGVAEILDTKTAYSDFLMAIEK